MSSEALRPIGEEESLENGMQLTLVGDPEKQLAQATRACAVLMRVVEEKHLFEEFGTRDRKKRHLLVEAWLFLAHMFGVTARLEAIVPVWDATENFPGFEATVEAVHMASGRVVGRAAARCMSDEENWGEVPKYVWNNGDRSQDGTRQKAMQQLESMAQTRATSKVLSNVFRWVVVLGAKGVSGTPAEEMGDTKRGKQQAGQTTESRKITAKQVSRLFAIGRDKGLAPNEVAEIFKRHGFQQSHEITVEKYDSIVAEVEGKPAEQQAP
jgi:hypothetical protein